MNVADSIQQFVGRILPFGAKSMPIPIVSDSWGGDAVIGGGSWQDFRFTESDFKRMSSLGGARGINSSVMQCIAKLVLAYSAAPLWMYDAEGAPIVDDRIRRLLKRPNDIMGEAKFHRLSMFYRAWDGDAYIKIVRADDGTPLELWPYSNTSIRPVPTQDEWIDHYEGTAPNGKKIPIPVKDIIHLPWLIPDADRPWKGMAPIFSIAKDLGVLDEITRIVYSVLKNDAVMKGGVFDSKGRLATPEQVEIYKGKLKAATTGEHRGEIGVFTGGMSYTRFALGLDELDLSPIAQTNEARVAGAFMVPLVFSGLIAGQDHSTMDNVRQAERQFYEGTIAPMWQSDADEYNSKLLGKDDVRYFWFYTKDLPALKADQNAVVDRVTKLVDRNLVSKDEARAMLDMEPAQEQEVAKENELRSTVGGAGALQALVIAYTGGQVTRESAIALGLELYGFDEATAGRLFPVLPKAVPVPAPKGLLGKKSADPWTQEKALEYFKRYDKPAEATAKKLKRTLAGLFDTLLVEVLGKLPTKAKKDDERLDPFDEEAAREAFAAATKDDIERLVTSQFARAVGDTGRNWSEIESDFDVAVNRVLDNSIDKITTSVGTVKEELRELLKANRDKTPTEVRDLITERFKDIYSESRAATIARTTATFATGASQKEAWTPFADEGTAVWLAVGDAATRPEHAAADGQLPDADGFYDIGGDLMEFPGGGSTSEMSINCRCVLRWRPRDGGDEE